MRLYYFSLYFIIIATCTYVTANNTDTLKNSKKEAYNRLDHTTQQLSNIIKWRSGSFSTDTHTSDVNTSHINTVANIWNTYANQQTNKLCYSTNPKDVSTIKGSIQITQGLAGIAIERPIHLVHKPINLFELAVDVLLLPWYIPFALTTPKPKDPAPISDDNQVTAQQYQAIAYMMYNLSNAQSWLSPENINKNIEQIKGQSSLSIDPMSKETQPNIIDQGAIEEQRKTAYNATKNLLHTIRSYAHNGINQLSDNKQIFKQYKENIDYMLNTGNTRPYFLNKQHQNAMNKTRIVAHVIHKDKNRLPYNEFNHIEHCRNSKIDLKPPKIPEHNHQKLGWIEWFFPN